MVNSSVVLIHLVHFSVQVTTCLWSESSRILIGAEGICIGFIDIIVLVGRIRFVRLLFRHNFSVIPVFLSNPPVNLIFGGVSALGIIYYRHCHKLFLHSRLKILVWCNYQLIFVSVHPLHCFFRNTSEFFPYYYRLYMCA